MRTDDLKHRVGSGTVRGLWLAGLMGLLLLGTQCFLGGFAWDGDWTDGKSGRIGLFDNPGSTDRQAGTDPPQKFYTPVIRDYIEADPEELDDYFHRRRKEYAPYALARITQDMHYGDRFVVPKGYYLIKPGDPQDGSPQVTLQGINPNPPLYPSVQSGSAGQVASTQSPAPVVAASQAAGQANPSANRKAGNAKADEPAFTVLLVKQRGKVLAVVPIHRRQFYHPDRKEKIPHRALAWVEEENRHPVLKFYYHHWIYSTDFQ